MKRRAWANNHPGPMRAVPPFAIIHHRGLDRRGQRFTARVSPLFFARIGAQFPGLPPTTPPETLARGQTCAPFSTAISREPPSGQFQAAPGLSDV